MSIKVYLMAILDNYMFWPLLANFIIRIQGCIYFRKPLLLSAVGLTMRCYLSFSACSFN